MIGVVFVHGAGAGAHEEDAPLAASLAEHLGEQYSVDFPTMPDDDGADNRLWHSAIAQAHRDLYAAAIPGAVARSLPGGHQVGADLRVVAEDIRRVLGERR